MSIKTQISQAYTSIRFDTVPIVDTDTYRRLNDQIPALCRTLPPGMQAEAMMFLMEYFRLQVGEPLDFFRHYYAPAWSVIRWLAVAPRAAGTLSDNDLDAALCCQAMAMLLHSLDDHLVDGGIPVSHLVLLIRSQAWRRMREAIERFASGIPGGGDIADGLIDDYYTGITRRDTPASLDSYCELFRRQMATWVVMPVLAAKKTGGDDAFVEGMRSAYESFGIAWRLLDDIQDLEADMADGTRSAVYICLDDDGRRLWDSIRADGNRSAGKTADRICALIRDGAIIETIVRRIVDELGTAASISVRLGLSGLADEYRALAGPVAAWLG
ncbi:MAG: class 1 isoprenoid biosynthesis enzyme [Spirochaetes bacterium]|nr:class 1 isoprenoid biosynthesis enzyme [Spirochaetota bacterium]